MARPRTAARPLFFVTLALLASCSATTPKPQHTPSPPAQVASAAPEPLPEHIPRERGIYMRQLLYLLQRGWRPPRDAELHPFSLGATAQVEIDKHGGFASFELSAPSGNAPFDRSVADHLQALIDRGARADYGPPYIVDRVFGEMLTVRFRGPPPPGTPPY